MLANLVWSFEAFVRALTYNPHNITHHLAMCISCFSILVPSVNMIG